MRNLLRVWGLRGCSLAAFVALVAVATPAAAATLRVSDDAARTDSRPLKGATVRDTVHIFLDAPANSTGAVFWLDDKRRQNDPYRVEKAAPYDLAGTRANGQSGAIDVRGWAPGQHVVTAALRDWEGRWSILHAQFFVEDHAELRMSLFPDRSGDVELESATVEGDIHVFANELPGVSRVSFYLDDQDAPLKVEGAAPWDLTGTRSDGLTPAFDTRSLSDGSHTIRAVVERSAGFSTTAFAEFEVANDPPEDQPWAVQVGHVRGSDAQIALIDFGNRVEVYVCGGPDSLPLTRWFSPVPVEAEGDGDTSPFAALDGLLSVEGLFGQTSSSGTLTNAETGEVLQWEAARPDGEDGLSGLYDTQLGPWRFGLIVHPEDAWGRRDMQGAGLNVATSLLGQVTPVLELLKGRPGSVAPRPITADVDVITDVVRLDLAPVVPVP